MMAAHHRQGGGAGTQGLDDFGSHQNVLTALFEFILCEPRGLREHHVRNPNLSQVVQRPVGLQHLEGLLVQPHTLC